MARRVARGRTFQVTVESLRPDGDGEAPLPDDQGGKGDARRVVVPRALPHERIEVEVVHVGHSVRAEPRRVITAHPHRVPAPCPHHATCTGCPLMVASVAEQRAQKRRWLADLGLQVDTVEDGGGPAWGYRWSSKRVAFGVPGDLKLGSFRRGTHEPADMKGCLVDHPDLVEAATEVTRVCNELRVLPYDESKRRGDLRAVWFRRNDEGQVLVALVTGIPSSQVDASRLPEVAPRLERPAGVVLAHGDHPGNDLRGTDVRTLAGASHIDVQWGDTSISVGALGFLQPNPVVARAAHLCLVGEERGDLAYDLYAGAGWTTRALRGQYERVVPCESYPESARALGIDPVKAIDFLRGRVDEGEQPSLVVANPPRRGLGPRVCAALRQLRPSCLRIMSCHPKSLMRDLASLEEGGAFLRGSVRAFDTLVHTAHVELVVELRASPA